MFFCKLLLNGGPHGTKIGSIRLVWAGAKNYKFSFLLCTGSLSKELNVILVSRGMLVRMKGKMKGKKK